MRRFAVILILGALPGCGGGSFSSDPQPVVQQPSNVEIAEKTPPKVTQAEAKRLMLKYKSRLFKDADSIKDAQISEPFTCFTLDGTDCICAEANARNSQGGYTGIQLIGFKFDGAGGIEGIGEMGLTARDGACGRLTPFPQLNGHPPRH